MKFTGYQSVFDNSAPFKDIPFRFSGHMIFFENRGNIIRAVINLSVIFL